MDASSFDRSHARRLARDRAARLAEAGALARALEVLLQRAGFATEGCRALAAQVVRQEQAELLRAHGRIESRRRFKHKSGHPLLETRQLSLLYVDESGSSSIDAQATKGIFAVGAIAISRESADAYRLAANNLKRDYFGDIDITFHEPFMRHRTRPFYFQGNPLRQQEFQAAVDQIVADTEFIAFGVCIRKLAFATELGAASLAPYLPTDVYSIAVALLLERYLDYLATQPGDMRGRVTFESQGPREDAYHQLEYARVLVDGTQWIPPTHLQHLLEPGVQFTPKRGSDPTELADMLARDIYEWVESGCTGSPGRWDLFGKKVYFRDNGLMGKFGIKIFPDSDIRDTVEAHRREVRAGRN